MTTRKSEPAGKARASASKSSRRTKRPPAERTGPDRSGRSAAHATARAERPADDIGTAKAPKDATPGIHIDDAVAEAVKSSYEVLSQTIAQGRAAAARFREGDYNIREVPRDFEAMARRLLELARQMSTTTFDVCEQLLQQVSSAAGPPPPGEVAAGLPAFRSLKDRVSTASASRSTTTQSPSAHDEASSTAARPVDGSTSLDLKVLFGERSSAKCLASLLQRPAKPTGVWQLHCAPLAPRSGDAAPIEDVKFAFDLARDGLAATVKIPDAQPSGTYSGLVFAETQDLPLGMLVVQVGV